MANEEGGDQTQDDKTLNEKVEFGEDELEGLSEEAQGKVKTALAQKNHFRGKYDKTLEEFETYKKDNPVKKEEKPDPKDTSKETDQPEGLNLMDKSYLNSEDIPKEDWEFIEKEMKETGKTVDTILGLKYVKEGLQERKEHRASDESGGDAPDRPGSSASTKVEYWLKQDKLPPIDQPELRKEVVNARIKADADSSEFTDEPVGNLEIR